MTYSKTHQRFADRLNNQRALEHPEDYLGPNWKDVLNFWWYLEGLSEDQCKIVRQRYWDLDDQVRNAVWSVAYAAYDSSARNAAGVATLDLIGSHHLLEQQKPLIFRLLFNDL
jgi:hypothetical protein